MRNKRSSTAVQRWGAKALTLLLACALMAGLAITASARGDWQGEVVDPAIPKPVVTIQGNLVTEKGKPTGFYELALCVRSGRTITDLTGVVGDPGSVIDEAAYAAYIEANPSAEGDTTLFDIHYYPFRTATAAMNVNTDILTAVNWNLTSVTYETYNAATDSYPSDVTIPGKYPRGINTDPIVQGYAESGLSEGDAFPDITTPNLDKADNDSIFVALDVEGDPRMSTVQGAAEHFENDAALITLTASAPDNYPVVLKESTPLVVARFSYDLKRFSTTKVSSSLSGTSGKRNSITGDAAAGADGFWMGWDKTSGFGSTDFSGKRALTWLGESSGTFDFSRSDDLASRTQGDQTVWVHTGINNGSLTDRETYFYYYLGAEEYQDDGADTVSVKIGNEATDVPGVTIPKTEGQKVLTEGTDRNNGTPPAEYTYFKNLLRLEDKTLVVKLVNEPTFKRPANANDNIILFYDWDDTLIGSLAVGKGDVRAEVEAYVEENLVHPALRPGSDFMQNAGKTGVDLDKLASLQRDYTYRGKYAYTVGGDDVDLGVTNGKEYPLTNKLDYVFTKRVNTTLTQTENGAKVQYVHPYAMNDPALDPEQTDIDATEFPYVYGWAVVEDTRAFNGKKDAVGAKGDWKVMHDAAKLEDFWTTMGVGELSNMTSTVMTNTTLSTVAAVDPAAERFAPVFLKDADSSWADGTRADADDYLYTLSGENSYLRFADFSDITAELERYEGKNTLIVKAVYEEGPELFTGGFYQLTKEPYYNKFSNPEAAAGGAYSVEVTLERISTQHADGQVRGVDRARMPAVRQDTTVDQKWIADAALGVDHNLNNTDVKTAKTLTETTFTKVDTDNGEEITFQLSLSARQNKVDYYLIETYGNNFVSGTTKSLTNYERVDSAHTIDNYNYYSQDSDDNDAYFDVTKYDERDGSHGYVLYGTLNYLMQQATLTSQGVMIRDDFNRASGYGVLKDANLRWDMSGTQPTATSQTLFRTKILDAAAACIANPTSDVWNAERGYAELSYHQLQYFILDDPVWSNRAAADAKPIAWCHLHASCAAAVSGKPKDWSELVAYAKDPTKADGIGELLPGEIETLFGLRKTNGAQYTTGAEFKANVVAAVNAGCESWAEVQYYILYKTAPADAAAALAEAKTSFWWYDGSTSAPGTPGNLRALITATDDYFKVVTLPDGTQEDGWTARLDRGKRNFDSNNDGDNTTVATGWKNMTQNLVAKWVIEEVGGKPTGAESTEKFADWESFRSELLRVVEIARAAGATPANDSEYWYKAQYLIIHPDETMWPTFSVGDGTTEGDELDGYWWHNGGTHLFINSLPSMLSVAGLVNDGDETAKGVWDRFRLADFLKCEDMTDFALNFTGTDKIDNMEADGLTPNTNEMNDFKNKILAVKEFGANNTWFDLEASTNANLWKDVQFWLLHEPSEVKPGIPRTEYQYYWWEDNGTPTAVKLEGKRGNVQSWLNAAFMEVYNGNTVAWDNLSADNADGVSNNAFNTTRLRNPAAEDVTPGNTTYQTPDEIPVLSAADIQTKMNALIVEIMAGKTGHATHTPPSAITWYQVQDYLITGTYTETPTAAQALAWEKQYWWLDKDENPDKKQEEVNTEALDHFITTFLQSATTIDTLTKTDFVSNEKGDLNFQKDLSAAISTAKQVKDAKARLKLLIADPGVAEQGGVSTLTWYQIQYALMDATAGGGEGAYKTPNQAYHALKDVATWAPDWVKKLPEPPAPEPLNYFVTTFLQSATTIDTLAKTDFASNEKGDLNFRKDSVTAISTAKQVKDAKARLKSLIAAAPDSSSLTWYQIQYALMDAAAGGGEGAYISAVDAYNWAQGLPVTWAPPTATTAPVPEGASLLALDIEIFEPEEPTAPTLDDLLAQKAELEKQLAALEEQITAAQEAAKREEEQTQTPESPVASAPTTRPSAGATTNTPAQPEPETPETPTEPETPAEPVDPVVNDHDERVEIPLGEDAISATRTPIAADESGSGYGEPSGSVTPERTQTDMPVPLSSKVYRIEALWKRRWVSVA